MVRLLKYRFLDPTQLTESNTLMGDLRINILKQVPIDFFFPLIFNAQLKHHFIKPGVNLILESCLLLLFGSFLENA